MSRYNFRGIQDKGKTISGPLDAVVNYTKDLNVIGLDRLGGLASAFVIDQVDQSRLPQSLSCTPIDLQKYFIKLTENHHLEAQI